MLYFRCGRITTLLRKSVKEFQKVGNCYERLYETSFDADPETLFQLRILQTLSSNIGSWIEIVCLKSSLQGSIYNETDIEFSVLRSADLIEEGLEIVELIETGQNIAKLFSDLDKNPDVVPMDNQHTDCLISGNFLKNLMFLLFADFYFKKIIYLFHFLIFFTLPIFNIKELYSFISIFKYFYTLPIFYLKIFI